MAHTKAAANKLTKNTPVFRRPCPGNGLLGHTGLGLSVLATFDMMMAMMDTVLFPKLLLWKQAPDLPRDRSFLAIHTHDEEFAV